MEIDKIRAAQEIAQLVGYKLRREITDDRKQGATWRTCENLNTRGSLADTMTYRAYVAKYPEP
jgi:hypothetical protein